MRSMPVERIWGAGAKAREKFKKYGYKTCDDIYRVSERRLCSIFGKAFGGFLYRAVRGQAAAAFDDVRGFRAMSAEHTVDYDIYDEFAIETAIMKICNSLMYRLLDCRWRSRTVFIKIRYEDFSTESARETSERAVGTMNDLFERVCALFHRKYKRGRGIRLVGAGLLNLETDGVCTGELFDFEDERKKKLEKCIHEINKRFPAAAIKKARLL